MMEEENIVNREFNLLIERHRMLISHLCIRAAWGRTRYVDRLVHECYVDIICHLAERLSAPGPQSEQAWVWGRCHNAISRFWRSRRMLPMLPLDDLEALGGVAGLDDMQLAAADFAATLHGTERRCFLLMAKGASDAELRQALHLTPGSLKQVKHRIKAALEAYIQQ